MNKHDFIRGYTHPLSVRPGDEVEFMVTATVPRYTAEVVRMLHADDRPGTPGLRAEPVPGLGASEHAGVEQPLAPGSYVRVPPTPALRRTALTFAVWVWPTTPLRREPQALASLRSPDADEGFALLLTAEGVRLSSAVAHPVARVAGSPRCAPLVARRLFHRLRQRRGRARDHDPGRMAPRWRVASTTGPAPVAPGSADACFLLAADAPRGGARAGDV